MLAICIFWEDPTMPATLSAPAFFTVTDSTNRLLRSEELQCHRACAKDLKKRERA
jgi:hypothetical protein